MTRLLLTRMARGTFLIFLAATGCRNSNAASQSENKPRPVGGQGPDVQGLPRDPGFKRTEVEQRRELLGMLDDKFVPLANPEATMDQQMKAKTTFELTFGPDAKLDKYLRSKVVVSKPNCQRNGCAVDVTYRDWESYVALNRAILDREPPSPFMNFPGARYRTGRTPGAAGTFTATWILAFPLRVPEDSYQKEVQ